MRACIVTCMSTKLMYARNSGGNLHVEDKVEVNTQHNNKIMTLTCKYALAVNYTVAYLQCFQDIIVSTY